MITSRAYLVGGMGFCFYLILLFNTNLPSQFYVLTWLSVGVLVSSLGVALLAMLGLHCEWHIEKARVAEDIERWNLNGRAALEVAPGPIIQIELGNSGSFNKTDLLFEVELFCPRRDEYLSRSFLIEALPAGNSLNCNLPLGDLPRGRYRIAGITIHGGDVLGLFRLRRRILKEARADLEELVVGPASLAPQRENHSNGAGLLEGVVRAASGRGSGDDFRGTRNYVPGDDLRTIHWRSTARRGHLVVKEFHHQEQAQRLIIWDGAAGFAVGEDAHSSTECALRLVASLCNALTAQRRRCGLLRLDSQPLFLAPPAGRSNISSQIIEVLADADDARQAPLSTAIGPFLRHIGAAHEVFLVTQTLSPEVLRAITMLRGRGVQVVVALIDASAFETEEAPRPNKKNAAKTNSLDEQTTLLQRAGVPVAVVPELESAREFIAYDSEVQLSALRVAVRTLTMPSSAKRLANAATNASASVAANVAESATY